IPLWLVTTTTWNPLSRAAFTASGTPGNTSKSAGRQVCSPRSRFTTPSRSRNRAPFRCSISKTHGVDEVADRTGMERGSIGDAEQRTEVVRIVRDVAHPPLAHVPFIQKVQPAEDPRRQRNWQEDEHELGIGVQQNEGE